MDFVKKNIKIVIGIIVLTIIAIVTFITLFSGNNDVDETNESNQTTTQQESDNDESLINEENDSPVSAINNDLSVSNNDITEPYKGTHFEWQPSNDLFFIHPDSQYIANESFDNDNEAPLDEAKTKAEEDCSVLGGTVTHSIFRINDNSEVKFNCQIN